MNALREAYAITFPETDASLSDWQIAQLLMERFDVAAIGEELAIQVVFAVVNEVIFPDRAITQMVVGRAEGYATELFCNLKEMRDDPHMAEIAWLQNMSYYQDYRKKCNNSVS